MRISDCSSDVCSSDLLVTAGGYPIQPPINVPDNALTITIARDGTVSVTQPGAAGTNVQIGQLQLSTFVNTTGLQSAGENLYVETDASGPANFAGRSEEHKSELQSLMRISYAVFCLKNNKSST